jgi:hypothetical protein
VLLGVEVGSSSFEGKCYRQLPDDRLRPDSDDLDSDLLVLGKLLDLKAFYANFVVLSRVVGYERWIGQ